MSNNNDNSGAIFGLAMICAAFWFLAIAAYAIACFIAAILTILSIVAWHRTVRIGSFVFHPHEARQFVLCGVIGAIGLPVFVILCTALFDFAVRDEWWFYIVTGGYAFGAIGLSILLQENGERIIEPLEGDSILPPPPAPQLPPARPEPFHYASWDDEETR